MTLAGAPRSLVRDHPFLVLYLVALAIVWGVTAATWTVRDGEPPSIHPLAQGLQYVLVAIAATLGGLRLRLDAREMRSDAHFRFYDLDWYISDDVGGQVFWRALAVGAAAMVVNVILLALADIVVGGGSAGLRTYLEWIGTGIAAGAVVGMFSAFLAVIVAAIVRRRRSY